MFRGSAPTKIDEKGRLKVPTDFLRVLEEQFGRDLFVTSVEGDCVHLYPLSVWERIEARLLAMPSTSPARQRYLERVNFFGQQVRLDNQGRLVIPQPLREKTGMQGDVVVNGGLDRLLVWNLERIEKRLEEQPMTEDDLRALSEAGI